MLQFARGNKKAFQESSERLLVWRWLDEFRTFRWANFKSLLQSDEEGIFFLFQVKNKKFTYL
jgi:hypothetical protein